MPRESQGNPIAVLTAARSWGGIERSIMNLSNEFLRQGFAVDLVLVGGGEVPYPDHLSEHVRIVDLNTRSSLRGVIALGGYFHRRQPAAALIAKHAALSLALRSKRWLRPNVPLYMSVRGTLRRNRRWQRRVRRQYPRTDGVVAISRGVAKDLTEFFGIDTDKVRVIYNPVVTPNFFERAARTPAHGWLKEEPRSEPVVLSAGRLVEAKNYPMLIQAVAKVRSTRPCRLLILGEGPQRPLLEQLIREHKLEGVVDLPGWTDDPLCDMARSDVFVLSSDHEGLGNVLIEAMAAGTPVVSTDCPSGPREILQDGALGSLVPTGDVDALADAIRRALDQPLDADTLKAGATRFRSDVIALQYLELMGLAETS